MADEHKAEGSKLFLSPGGLRASSEKPEADLKRWGIVGAGATAVKHNLHSASRNHDQAINLRFANPAEEVPSLTPTPPPRPLLAASDRSPPRTVASIALGQPNALWKWVGLAPSPADSASWPRHMPPATQAEPVRQVERLRPRWVSAQIVERLRLGRAPSRLPGATLPHAVQWLSDNGPQYMATATVLYTHELGLVPITTPAYSPRAIVSPRQLSAPSSATAHLTQPAPPPHHPGTTA